MRLEQLKAEPIEGATWLQVEAALDTLDPAGNGFVILSDGAAGYIQTTGAVDRLTMEYRTYTASSGKGFRHYVLARSGGGKAETRIAAYSGPITLQEDEVLTLADAKRAFRHFFDTGAVPEDFELHDITDIFK